MYAASIRRALLRTANLSAPNPYPTHRARPRQITSPTCAAPSPSVPTTPITLEQARAAIRCLTSEHAQHGAGFLLLAHPPGAGKGQNTIEGLKDYLRADPDPGSIVWAALHKGQIADQHGLAFVALHGRHGGNCHKLPEVQELSRKGYSVRAALCRRRCPHAATLLGWLGQILATTADRSLSGTLLYQELDALAEADGLDVAETLQRAIDALPDPTAKPPA